MGQIAYAIQLLSSLPSLIQAGADIAGIIKNGTETMKEMQKQGRDPTKEEWDALNEQIKALQDQLHS